MAMCLGVTTSPRQRLALCLHNWSCLFFDTLYSEDFSLLMTFFYSLLFRGFPWLFRGFFVALICLEKQCLGLFRGFFMAFPWIFCGFFRGPRFGQSLCVLALEKSSDICSCLWGRFQPKDSKGRKTNEYGTQRTKIAQSQSLAISTLMEPNRKKSCGKNRF